MSNGRRAALILVAAAAFLGKTLLAFETYGTNDVYGFYRFSEWSRYLGVSLYRTAWDFNHPPSMIHALRFCGWLSRITPLPFELWLRLPGILADLGSLWILSRILAPRMDEKSVFWPLLLFAAAPASILISGFHGNTDPVLIFFLLFSVYLTESRATLAGGAAFGLAMSVKVMPIVLIPVIVLYLSGRKRVEFFGAAATVISLCWSPFIFQDPGAVWHGVFAYRSYYGIWGLSFLAEQLSWLAPELSWADNAFHSFGEYFVLGLIALLAWWMNRTGSALSRPRLFSQTGITLFLFLSISNGFSLQYLAWLVPWVTELGGFPTMFLYATSGCFLFVVYNYWAQGIPWYLADSNRMGAYNGRFDYFQLLCWLSVVVVFWISWKRIAEGLAGQPAAPLSRAALAVRCAGGLLAISSICAMIPPQDRSPVPHTGKDAAAVLAINAQDDLDLSLLLYGSGRFQDSIAAAKDALRFRPGSADAYNNIANADARLGMWDDAITASSESLRLKPGFQSAQSNLDSALKQRNGNGVR